MSYDMNEARLDCGYASNELLLFDFKQVITMIDFSFTVTHRGEESLRVFNFNAGQATFQFLDIDYITAAYFPMIPSKEVILDAMVLSGVSKLAPFPLPADLNTPLPAGEVFPVIVDQLMKCGADARNMCQAYSVPPGYYEHYQQTVIAIRHMIILYNIGKVEPRTGQQAPSDLHVCIGIRIPDELNYYMGVGLIKPEILNWLNSGVIRICAPYTGGDDQNYQNLVKNQLGPWRELIVSLLRENLHRFFSIQDLTTKFWFEPHESHWQVSKGADITAMCPKDVLFTFRVRQKQLVDRARKLKVRVYI